jgi:ADP-ribose pyrophosphatase
MKEITFEEKRIFSGNLLNLNADRVILTNGIKTYREYVSHPGAVAALPFLNSSEIILVKQYRYSVGEFILEIPAGTIEKGETPEDCVTRELQEEINYKPGKLENLGWIYLTPGYSNEKIHLFKATNLKVGVKKTEEDENIEVVKMKLEEALSKIHSGEIKDGKTVIAILSHIDRAV